MTRSGNGAKATRRNARRERVSADEIVRAALAVIDADGLGAFSIRRLADHMGIGAMTVYYYFDSKAKLLDGVGEFLENEIRPTIQATLSWEENLARAIREFYDALNDYPGAAELLLSKGLSSPRLPHLREALVVLLRDAGLDGPDAIETLSTLVAYAFGCSLARRAHERGNLAERLEHLESLNSEEFPNLSAAKHDYGQHLTDRAFDRGLARYIKGLEAELEA